ncbi:MAG: hypothetical protein ACR2IP_10300 [Solirubrobacteraceae bacterium]
MIVYLAAAALLFGRPLWHGGAHECLCIGTDEGIFAWGFAWWPHALWHGLNPFYSHLLYAPRGFDLALSTMVPGAALIFAPITAIAGPLSAFNVAMLLSPVLAAFFAFLLCRRLTRAFWPALLGGWLFGFSTYMLGQLLGHLNLTLVFLVPAIAHLAILAFANEISRRRFVALLVVALVLQFSFSPEVLVSLTLFGFAAVAIGYALGDPGARAALRGLLAPVALAYLLTAVLVSPYLYYAFQPGKLPILLGRTNMFSNDLLGFAVPTQLTALGGLDFLSTSRTFSAGVVEGGAYLGLPLILMMLLGVRAGWRRVEVRVMLGTLLIVLVCTLGGHLHIGGHAAIPLPWAVGHRLPVLGQLLPSRFILYGVLIGAMLAAMWLARSGPRLAPWLLAIVSVVSLWPAVGRGYWRSVPDLPRLFTTSAYRQAIRPSDTALLLPVGGAGQSMLWQAQARLGFTMAGGYGAPAGAEPYMQDPIYPTLTSGVAVPHQQAAARRFLVSHHVTVAVLDPHEPTAAPWIGIIERLGWRAQMRGSVCLLRPAS